MDNPNTSFMTSRSRKLGGNKSEKNVQPYECFHTVLNTLKKYLSLRMHGK